MNKSSKTAASTSSFISSLFLMVCLSMPFVANAQQTVFNDGSTNNSYRLLDQAQLDQALAPIALYPDSLLSQILVAATYPFDVVQANRWRQDNYKLSESQVIAAIEYRDWDPSVKALTPFTDLLARLSDDLYWLEQIGDAFLQNEGQVLATVQDLRQRAYSNGSLRDSDYYHIVEDDGYIVIHSTNTEIVHVPYYDSRVVYGRWAWSKYKPVYWKRPSNYRLHAGFYWSSRFYIRPTIFFGGFHWGSRNLVVNHHYYDKPYRQQIRYRNIGISKYSRWKHNSAKRRGVRYSRNGNKNFNQRNKFNSRSINNRQNRSGVNQRRSGGNGVAVNRSANRGNTRQAGQRTNSDNRRVVGRNVDGRQLQNNGVRNNGVRNNGVRNNGVRRNGTNTGRTNNRDISETNRSSNRTAIDNRQNRQRTDQRGGEVNGVAESRSANRGNTRQAGQRTNSDNRRVVGRNVDRRQQSNNGTRRNDTNISRTGNRTVSSTSRSSNRNGITNRGNTYKNNRNAYKGSSYKGGSYKGNSYKGNSYKGNSYKGNSYKGNSYKSNNSSAYKTRSYNRSTSRYKR